MAANGPNAPQKGKQNALSGCGSAHAFGGKAGVSEAAKAIHQIYSDDYEECLSYARSRLGSIEVAQDVVQQAFTNTLNAVEDGAEIGNLGGFIRRCVHNLCVNRGYREHREPALSLEERLHEMTGGSTAGSAELRQQWREVESVVDQLAPNQRDAFLLREIRGYSYKDTAMSMNLSVGSVRQLLNRARNKIRARVDAGPDAVGIPAPALKINRVLAHNVHGDYLRPIGGTGNKLVKAQSWLNNIVQQGWDSMTQPAAPLIAGIAVTLAVVPGGILNRPGGTASDPAPAGQGSYRQATRSQPILHDTREPSGQTIGGDDRTAVGPKFTQQGRHPAPASPHDRHKPDNIDQSTGEFTGHNATVGNNPGEGTPIGPQPYSVPPAAKHKCVVEERSLNECAQPVECPDGRPAQPNQLGLCDVPVDEPDDEPDGAPGDEPGGTPEDESDGAPGHEPGGTSDCESCDQPEGESGGKPEDEPGGKPDGESDGKPAREPK